MWWVLSSANILLTSEMITSSLKTFNDFGKIKDNETSIGIFMYIWMDNKRIEFQVKIPSSC